MGTWAISLRPRLHRPPGDPNSESNSRSDSGIGGKPLKAFRVQPQFSVFFFGVGVVRVQQTFLGGMFETPRTTQNSNSLALPVPAFSRWNWWGLLHQSSEILVDEPQDRRSGGVVSNTTDLHVETP